MQTSESTMTIDSALVFRGVKFGKSLACASNQFAASQFQKCRQLFIRMRNETLSIVAMCVCNCEIHFRRSYKKVKLLRT
jgi:hypothetical protein